MSARTATSAKPTLYDANGRPVALGASVGRGGEAEVFAIPMVPGLVAKVYHEVPNSSRGEKLAVMASAAAQNLLRVAAWPTGTLHIQPGGAVTGLVMPKIERHRELHALYSPAQRRQTFPQADWRFLLHVAANVARAVGVVHAAGHVIGDVNQKNFVVNEDALVKLLDCDSFQISVGGKRFPCEVGVADFTPPELHGQPFKGVIRTQNHDSFGLAILIFHLLFMGRHPFAGVYRKGGADMPTERAIREGRYVYSIHAARFEMDAPPHSLPPAAGATAEVAGLFERAFSLQQGAATRPTAADWVSALVRMQGELLRCGAHRGHMFVGSSCPWCAIERGGGPDFFLTLAATVPPAARAASASSSVWNLDALLLRAQAIPQPPAPLPVALRQPPPKAGVASQVASNAPQIACAVLFYAVAAVCFFGMFEVGWLFFVMLGAAFAGNKFRHDATAPKIDPALRDHLERAARAHGARVSDWERDVAGPAKLFQDAVRALDEKQRAYRNLSGEHQRARQDVHNNQRQIQLRHHLERFYVRSARIDGVGPGLKQTLMSFGIETAADVVLGSVMRVPGFGPARTHALLAWRQTVEARFVFDPNKGVDPADLSEVDQRFAAKRQKLEKEMEGLVAQMQSHSTRTNGAAQRLQDELLRTGATLAVAKARAGQR